MFLAAVTSSMLTFPVNSMSTFPSLEIIVQTLVSSPRALTLMSPFLANISTP